jgi:hypothetical protein
MPQPSVEVSSILLPRCFLVATFLSSERARGRLSEMLNVNLAVVAGEQRAVPCSVLRVLFLSSHEV